VLEKSQFVNLYYIINKYVNYYKFIYRKMKLESLIPNTNNYYVRLKLMKIDIIFIIILKKDNLIYIIILNSTKF
jgi:hypothetical protein